MFQPDDKFKDLNTLRTIQESLILLAKRTPNKKQRDRIGKVCRLIDHQYWAMIQRGFHDEPEII